MYPLQKEHAQEMIDEMTGKSQSAGHQKRQHVDHEKGSHETDDEHNNRVSPTRVACLHASRFPSIHNTRLMRSNQPYACSPIVLPGHRRLPSHPQQPPNF